MIFATYDLWMNKKMHQIRLDNLQRLIDDYQADPGNRAAFCRAYGLDSLQIGQYFTGGENGRNIGERKARTIEESVGLESGWMDRQVPLTVRQDVPVYFEAKIAPKAPTLDLVYVTHDEIELLTLLRQATAAGKEILFNVAREVEKDQAKLKKLLKATR